MTSRRPTIRDVASAAGVSIGTVSHVLTGRKAVRPATRRTIEAAIGRLGYVPDPAARALIARRSRAPTPPDPSRPRLTTVGYLCADHTARVSVLPHRDDRVMAAAIEKTLGGCAANVAVTAAGLGSPFEITAELLSVVGDDADSTWAEAVLASRGVSLHPLSRQPGGRLSRCFILVEAQGSRTIVNEPLQVPPGVLERWLETKPCPMPGGHCLCLQGDQVIALHAVLPEVRAQGFKLALQATALAAAWRTPQGLARLRGLFDVIVLNDAMAASIVGLGFQSSAAELIRRLTGMAVVPGATLVLTLGAEGAVLLRPGQTAIRRTAPYVRPVDTTGAGDSFTGAFLAAWLHKQPPSTALALAVAAGSRAVQMPGAQEHGLRASDLLDTAPNPIGENRI